MQAHESSFTNWIDKYEMIRPKHERFVSKLQALLTELLELNQIPYHTIEGRAKTLDSFREKIRRPGKNYTSPLTQMPDLSALRIILYYTSDLQRVSDLLAGEFKIDVTQSSDKADELALDQFGYLSVHKVISLDERRLAITEWAPFEQMTAEVQLRTVLQHAWASISHKLQYKRESEIPVSFRRKLVRLAGLLELADDQFAELNTAQSEFKKEVSNRIASGEKDIAIDRITIQEFLAAEELVKEITKVAEIPPFGAADDSPGVDAWDQLLRVCALLQIDTLNDLKTILRRLQPRLGDFFDSLREEFNQEMLGDLPHWTAVLLVGYDHGQLLKIRNVPWADIGYTKAIFDAGEKIFE